MAEPAPFELTADNAPPLPAPRVGPQPLNLPDPRLGAQHGPAEAVATSTSGIRAFDPASETVITLDPERMGADFMAGRVKALSDEKYAMRDEHGEVWDIPGREVSAALGKGLTFAAFDERQQQVAESDEGAWGAVASSALRAAPFGAGDALLAQELTPEQLDLVERQRAAHPTASAAGAMLGAGVNLAATGGVGGGGLLAGRAATQGLLSRGVSPALARLGGAGAEGAVEGAVYGLGTAISEEALGHTEDVAESMLAHTGAGALLGGAIGLGLRGAGDAGRWLGSKSQVGAKEAAAFIRRQAGREPPKSLAEAAADAANGKPVNDGALDLAAGEVRHGLERMVGHQRDARTFGALTPAGQATPGVAPETLKAFNRLFVKDGKVDSAKVHRFVKRLPETDERFASDMEVVEAYLAGHGDDAAVSSFRETLDAARQVTEVRAAQRAELAGESAMGDGIEWAARGVGFSVGGGAGGAVAGMAARAVAKPRTAAQQRMQLAARLDDTRERVAAAAQRFVAGRTARATDAAVSTARKAAPPSRLIAATAVMLSDARESERAAAYNERVTELRALADNPDAFASRVEQLTAPLNEGLPATRHALASYAGTALAYLTNAIPRSYQPDAFAIAPAVPAVERQRFARVDAVLQDPMRVMERDATPDEHQAVREVYPRLYASMQAEVVNAVAAGDPSEVSWDVRRRLALLWGAETHEAFGKRHVMALQAALQAAPEPPAGGPPPPPRPSPAAVAASDHESP